MRLVKTGRIVQRYGERRVPPVTEKPPVNRLVPVLPHRTKREPYRGLILYSRITNREERPGRPLEPIVRHLPKGRPHPGIVIRNRITSREPVEIKAPVNRLVPKLPHPPRRPGDHGFYPLRLEEPVAPAEALIRYLVPSVTHTPRSKGWQTPPRRFQRWPTDEARPPLDALRALVHHPPMGRPDPGLVIGYRLSSRESVEEKPPVNRLEPIVRHPRRGRPYPGEAKYYRLSSREPVTEALIRALVPEVSHTPRSRLLREIAKAYPLMREQGEKVPETLSPKVRRFHRARRARW